MNFRRLVLGCMDTSDSESMRIFTIFQDLHNFLARFCGVLQTFATIFKLSSKISQDSLQIFAQCGHLSAQIQFHENFQNFAKCFGIGRSNWDLRFEIFSEISQNPGWKMCLRSKKKCKIFEILQKKLIRIEITAGVPRALGAELAGLVVPPAHRAAAAGAPRGVRACRVQPALEVERRRGAGCFHGFHPQAPSCPQEEIDFHGVLSCLFLSFFQQLMRAPTVAPSPHADISQHAQAPRCSPPSSHSLSALSLGEGWAAGPGHVASH